MGKRQRVMIAALLLASAPAAHAQFAVIDVAAIAKMVQQITTMSQQLTTLENQLRQAEEQYQAITGDRGMENLLSGVNYNYLPTDWATLMAAMNQTASGYPALSTGIQANISANAVLSASQIASLSATEQAQLLADRQTAALLEGTVQQALSTTSNRFASLQQLVTAIGSAQDAKASLDLQVRVAAEQTMVQNDQSKLQALYQAAEAQRWADEQRSREAAISDIGSLRSLPAMGL